MRRDKTTGRFRSMADEVLGVFDLIILAFKLLLILLVLYWIYYYFSIDEFLKNQFIKVAFGNTCKIVCEKKDNRSGYFN